MKISVSDTDRGFGYCHHGCSQELLEKLFRNFTLLIGTLNQCIMLWLDLMKNDISNFPIWKSIYFAFRSKCSKIYGENDWSVFGSACRYGGIELSLWHISRYLNTAQLLSSVLMVRKSYTNSIWWIYSLIEPHNYRPFGW